MEIEAKLAPIRVRAGCPDVGSPVANSNGLLVLSPRPALGVGRPRARPARSGAASPRPVQRPRKVVLAPGHVGVVRFSDVRADMVGVLHAVAVTTLGESVRVPASAGRIRRALPHLR